MVDRLSGTASAMNDQRSSFEGGRTTFDQ